MTALIKREFWEHRGAFIKAPLIVGIVFLVTTLGAYITMRVVSAKVNGEEILDRGITELASFTPEQLVQYWDINLLTTSMLYLGVLFVVLFFFLLNSLFDDRKDGSIQFWKSLPISDTETVLSKLLTAMFFVPIAFVAFYFMAQLAVMILQSILGLFHGLNPWTLIWVPAPLFKSVGVMLMGALVQMAWALPIYGWLMFASSFSKRRPFLFAVVIPFLFGLAWYWFNLLTKLQFMNAGIMKSFAMHTGHALVPYTSASRNGWIRFDPDETTMSETIGTMLESLNRADVYYGIVFAAVMVSISIWVRRYRNTA